MAMTFDEKAAAANSFRAQAAELVKRAEALEANSSRRFDNAPGAYVTGPSGRRKSGLHAKTNRAIEGSLDDLAKARKLRDRAAGLEIRADIIDPVKTAERRARAAKVKDQERKFSAAIAKLPLINDPDATFHMGSHAWAKIHRNFKNIALRTDGRASWRVRMAMRGGALRDVFLVDKKVVSKPSVET
jgi:hypothetical protein